ncbi:outer membrane beta-barrel protein [Chitinophaga lutea]
MSEQFENSIRKKLQEGDYPFDPDAWEQMKKRLDDSDDRRRPIIWWWLGALLLLGGAAGLWWMTSGKPDKPGTISMETTATTAPNSTEKNTASPGDNNTAGYPQQPEKLSTTTPHSNGVSVQIPLKSATSKGLIVSSENNPHPSPTNVTSVPASTTDVTAQPLSSIAPATPPATNVTNAPVPVASKDSSTQEKKTARPQRRGFDIGLNVGPEFSATPSFQYGRFGIGGGLLVRYHFNNRWMMNTGVAYTKKLYGAKSDEYTSAYPAYYKRIDADCNVIDVPLNVHYTFSENKRSIWRAMAGASSFFMVKEQYEYYYQNGSKREREYNNENQHYFSVLNLGVSWEKKTGGPVKWGVQPYAKIPLGGVGQGKVKLVSVGVSLQATIGKQKY